MIRAAALAVFMCVGGCQSTPPSAVAEPIPAREKPPVIPPKATETKREKYPSWATEDLPEDRPREFSTKEAVNLACRRLNIIKHANCLTKLRKAYSEGKDVDPSSCKLNLDKGCNHP